MSIFDIILNHPLGSMLEYTIRTLGSFGIGLIVFTFLTKVLLFPLSSHHSAQHHQADESAAPMRRQSAKSAGPIRPVTIRSLVPCTRSMAFLPLPAACRCWCRCPFSFRCTKLSVCRSLYMLKLSTETITAIDSALGLGALASKSVTAEVTIAEAMYKNFDKLVSQGIVPPTVTPLNYNFLGMNLASKPSLAINMLLLIPIFAGATAFLQSWYQAKSQPPAPAAAATSKSLMYTMPLLSIWITFSLPAGAGLSTGVCPTSSCSARPSCSTS